MKIKVLPDDREIEASPGDNLLEILTAAGIALDASCGGAGVCGQCRVRLLEGELDSEPAAVQTQEEFDQGWRQACLSTVVSDAVIEIPAESRLESEVVLEHRPPPSGQFLSEEQIAALNPGWEFAPPLRKLLVKLPPPTPEDNISDQSRLARALRQEHGIENMLMDLSALRALPRALREGDWTVTVTVVWTRASDAFLKEEERIPHHHLVVRVEPGDTRDRHFALALDIGTTTVSGQVLDLHTGQVNCTLNEYNGQVQYGADVISRIIFSLKPKGLETLQAKVVDTINAIIEKLSEQCGIQPTELSHLYAAGNTTMTHLLLKLTPKWLREAPYVPVTNRVGCVNAQELGIRAGSWVRLYLFPCVASYVGGDITAGVLATGMYKRETMSLLIDIGTNGEIVIGNRDFLLCASCSAGPAFEGGGITCGMHAGPGAIERFAIDPRTWETRFDTIRRQPARGICGSGIINVIAGLLSAGVIEPNGKLNLDPAIPITRQGRQGPEAVIAPSDKTEDGVDIVITEPDIDNLMRAKAALYAGYSTLLEHVGLDFDAIDDVFLAGNFGNTLDIENAITIGLLPDIDREKFKFVGNTSLRGARLVAQSSELLYDAENIARMMTNVEFWDNPRFMEHYMASMFFPHTDQNKFPSVAERLSRVKK